MSTIADNQQRLAELYSLRDRVDSEIQRLTPKRRPKRIPPACGTESGYQRHRYLSETCDECRRAHAIHNRSKDRATRRTAA